MLAGCLPASGSRRVWLPVLLWRRWTSSTATWRLAPQHACARGCRPCAPCCSPPLRLMLARVVSVRKCRLLSLWPWSPFQSRLERRPCGLAGHDAARSRAHQAWTVCVVKCHLAKGAACGPLPRLVLQALTAKKAAKPHMGPPSGSTCTTPNGMSDLMHARAMHLHLACMQTPHAPKYTCNRCMAQMNTKCRKEL